MTETAAPAAPAWATTYTARALAALPADITTATPPQVDEVIRTAQLDIATQERLIEVLVEKLHKAMGETQHETDRVTGYDFRNRPQYAKAWPTTTFELLTTARALPADTPAKGYLYGVDTIGEILAPIDVAAAAIEEAQDIVRTCSAEFARRGGWTRFYRVDRSNGHVHTTTSCRETYATTQWQWPTNLSGSDGAQVVEYAGPLTCLTCFPDEREEILADRPVRFDMFETPEQRAERVARETAAAERTAAKIAKGVTADGSALKVRFNTGGRYDETAEIKTERAAELRYVEWAAKAERATIHLRGCSADMRTYHTARRDGYREGAAVVLAALAAKRGTTPAALAEKLAAKVTKKANTLY